MSDGHTGIKNERVNEGRSGPIEMVLAALQHASGEAELVVHARSSTRYSFGLQPHEFLEQAGLSHYGGGCIFFGNECFYRSIATLEEPAFQREFTRRFQRVRDIHAAFKQLIDNLGRLFELEQERNRLLAVMQSATRRAPIFGQAVRLQAESEDVPDWVDEVAFPQLIDLMNEREALDLKISDLTQFRPLLYASGDELEVAVAAGLETLGLAVERTEPGFTADLLAQTDDAAARFGIEVTGIAGPVKKDSPKLTQVLEFERIKEHDEKTVLLANTFRNLPIDDRPTESFTSNVVEFLARNEILLMTTWNLYQLVGRVLAGEIQADDVIERMANSSGVFDPRL